MISTETTYYPTNDAGYPNWPRTRDNMHEKGPNDSRVFGPFFSSFCHMATCDNEPKKDSNDGSSLPSFGL